MGRLPLFLSLRCASGPAARTASLLPPRRSARRGKLRYRIETRIILIDGTELARLMIAHGAGVTPVAVYELKRVDSDFFAEE